MQYKRKLQKMLQLKTNHLIQITSLHMKLVFPFTKSKRWKQGPIANHHHRRQSSTENDFWRRKNQPGIKETLSLENGLDQKRRKETDSSQHLHRLAVSVLSHVEDFSNRLWGLSEWQWIRSSWLALFCRRFGTRFAFFGHSQFGNQFCYLFHFEKSMK